MIDGLPEQVEIAGQMVPISSDFRTGILFEEVLQDSGLDDLEKLQTALHLYFPGVVFDYDVLDEALGKLVAMQYNKLTYMETAPEISDIDAIFKKLSLIHI